MTVSRTSSAISSASSPLDLGGTGARHVVAPAPSKGGGLHREVKNTHKYPNRTHGKVYFSSGALDYVCSGTVVRAPSKSLVWTAGHCVYDTETLTRAVRAARNRTRLREKAGQPPEPQAVG